MESGEETLVGGQAVLEGVMMRSPHAWGICIRRPKARWPRIPSLWNALRKAQMDGLADYPRLLTLGHAMALGFRALRYSANVAMAGIRPKKRRRSKSRAGRSP